MEGLFEVAASLTLSEGVAAALASAVEQAEVPLPPGALLALHRYLPSATELLDRALTALARVVGPTDAPPWSAASAEALRGHVEGERYPVTTAVRDAVAEALVGRAFGPLEGALFGALCRDHARGP